VDDRCARMILGDGGAGRAGSARPPAGVLVRCLATGLSGRIHPLAVRPERLIPPIGAAGDCGRLTFADPTAPDPALDTTYAGGADKPFHFAGSDTLRSTVSRSEAWDRPR
jgi:hypothetical protein